MKDRTTRNRLGKQHRNMNTGIAVLAEVMITVGSVLIKVGSRKLLPLLAEKLDAPELMELDEIIGLDEIRTVALEALGRRNVQS